MIFMLLNIVFGSWMIGSITLLIVKMDENTSFYRDTLAQLDQYSSPNSFDKPFHKRLKKQLKLDFNHREISGEQVLGNFPSSIRRKVLRKLYLNSLIQTDLMDGIRQQFVDTFLTTCRVELFSAGEEILQRGNISSDLYLLVEGSVKKSTKVSGTSTVDTFKNNHGLVGSIADSDIRVGQDGASRDIKGGEFINEIGFFTESPQIETVRTMEVCKTLTMSRSAYKSIADDHPDSAGKILQNLLIKIEEMAVEVGYAQRVNLPKKLEILRAGSVFDNEGSASDSHTAEINQHVAAVETETALTATRDLVQMHISKQKDDQTTRFLVCSFTRR